MHGTLPIQSTYKTADELKLTQDQFDALAWFVDQYDAGVIQDIPSDSYVVSFSDVEYLEKFTMQYIGAEFNCGTAGCICGWIDHRVKNKSWPISVFILFSAFPRNTKAANARDATVRVLQGKPAWKKDISIA